VFINVGEAQPVVYFRPGKLSPQEYATLPLRRCYDVMENLYRYRGKSESGWLKFGLDQGSDYHCATDIFSLGVTLAFLATGLDDIISPFDYVERLDGADPGWQIVRGGSMLRPDHTTKARLVDALSEATTNRLKALGSPVKENEVYDDSLRKAEVILQCVSSRANRRARSAKHVMSVLDLFRPPDSKASATEAARALADPSWQELASALNKAAASYGDSGAMHLLADKLLPDCPTPARAVVAGRVSAVLEQIHCASDRSRPFVQVTGSRESLVNFFLSVLHSFNSGDNCVALTSAAFWSDENFAPYSRTSSMLQLLRLRGVRLQWIILVRSSELYMPQVQRILGFRCADDQRISRLRLTTHSQDAYFYACVDDPTYEHFLRGKKSFFGVRSKEDKEKLSLLVAPDFVARGGAIAAMTSWVNPQRDDLLRFFDEQLKIAMPVQYFDRIL
jgi:hypothetical protein